MKKIELTKDEVVRWDDGHYYCPGIGTVLDDAIFMMPNDYDNDGTYLYAHVRQMYDIVAKKVVEYHLICKHEVCGHVPVYKVGHEDWVELCNKYLNGRVYHA